MSLRTISDEVYSSFLLHSADARAVLLHASSRYRSVLISRLLASTDRRTFYYAMSADDIDVPAFLSGLTHDLSEQVPAFGNNVNRIGFTNVSFEDLAAALAADLNTLSAEPSLLILDEFDQAEIEDDLQVFLEVLIDHLPTQCQLVFNSRSLPRLPWIALIAQKKAIMLRDSELVTSNFYQPLPAAESRIQVFGLGPGHVVLDGKLIDTWEGHLPRLLLFFSLDRPVVTRSEICHSFWSDMNTDQAVNVFHVTKRRLHKALEAIGLDILIHEGGYYRVNPLINIQYDVIQFVEALIEGRTAADKAVKQAAWQRAIELYQHPFLQGHHEDWITQRREEYQTGYIEALSELARIRYQDGKPELALGLLQRAAADDPLRQSVHRDIMRLYAELNRRSETAGHYQKITADLHNRGSAVEPETTRLYNELMTGN
jgi:DNA-binding SARP family transcriptional activator